jgi:hypothetical protein
MKYECAQESEHGNIGANCYCEYQRRGESKRG